MMMSAEDAIPPDTRNLSTTPCEIRPSSLTEERGDLSEGAEAEEVEVDGLEMKLLDDEMKDSEDDATAVTIQTSEPRQPILKVYSPRQYGTIYRDFQGDWYKKYPWLEYDTELKAATCFTCRTFLNHNWTFSQWKNSERMKNHATSANHVLSAQKWMDSKLTASGKKSVLALLKTQHAEEVERNRSYLKLLLETVGFLSTQNIAFRSHREDRSDLSNFSDENRGNFLEVLSLRSRDNEFLRARLQSKMWLSPACQNEMIEIIGSQCLEKIISEVTSQIEAEGSPYAVICDETSDISRHEQFSLCVSYIDKTGQKQETFLKFLKVESTSGESLFNTLSENLLKIGLDPKQCYGLALDGASNMSGIEKGLATRMKAISPQSVYIHCHGHLLNLAIKDTLSGVKILKDSLGTIQSLYNFIEASPKRHAVYMNIENNNDNSESDSKFIRVLKSQSVTRWACHSEAVKAVSEEFSRVILCLDQIENDETSDSKTTSQAKALLLNILDFEFVFGLELLKVILIQTSSLSSYLQGKNVDIRTARLKADLVIKVLEDLRAEEEFNMTYEKTEKLIKNTEELLKEQKIDYEIRPAKISRRSKFSGDIQQFYRVTNYYEPLDKLLKELKMRFSVKGQETLTNLTTVIFENEVKDEAFEDVSKFYGLDIDLLKAPWVRNVSAV